MFLTITLLELFLILAGLFCLRKGGPVILYLVLLITIVDFLNENIIVTHSKSWWHVSRNVFYNAYSLIEISCWLFIYHHIFKRKEFKRLIIALGFVVITYSLAELFYLQNFTIFHTASYACFSIISLFLSVTYLFKVTRQEYHSLTDDPAFWLCAAAICFNAIFIINLITMLDTSYWSHNGSTAIFHIMQSVGIIIYYVLICTSFIISFYRYPKITIQAL